MTRGAAGSPPMVRGSSSARGPGPDGLEGDVSIEDEGPRGALEDLVDGLHQGARRAVVLSQGVDGALALGMAAGGHVGEDVGAPEGIDGLLGVADQIEPDPGVGGVRPRVDPLEDAVLEVVGVLELVDQGVGILGAQTRGQGRSMGALQGLGGLAQ